MPAFALYKTAVGEILPVAEGASTSIDEIAGVFGGGIHRVFGGMLRAVGGIGDLVEEARQKLEVQEGAGDTNGAAHFTKVQGERPDLVRGFEIEAFTGYVDQRDLVERWAIPDAAAKIDATSYAALDPDGATIPVEMRFIA